IRPLYAAALIWEAQRDLLAAYVRDHPTDRDVGLLLAYLHHASGSHDRALAIIRRITDADPQDDIAALLRDAVKRVHK
ncbi:MAG: tetratricopeptide repeat protein, partial [Myxococcota bacterium]